MLKKLPLNKLGRDFVVGDIHFKVDDLLRGLSALNFDSTLDRLIAVGDVVDRGPEMVKGLNLLEEPWFHTVKGNHEWMLQEAFSKGPQVASRGNGAEWWLSLTRDAQELLVHVFESLPVAMEIESENGLVGVVHANVPSGLSWNSFTSRLDEEKFASPALWDCSRILTEDKSGVPGLWRLCVGHTKVPSPLKLGNVLALDVTGGLEGPLAIYCIHTDQIYIDGVAIKTQ